MGDLLADPVTGRQLSQGERYRMLVDGAVRAEAAGFCSASVGEHHFCEYIVSAPPVLLAAMAERTSTIRLGTAVALGANNDPVRLAEDYATLDVLSGGRVELVVGRGNLYEHTFTAFGQDPGRSREMYDERVRLLVRLLGEEQVDWSGFDAGAVRPLHHSAPAPAAAPAGVGRGRLLARLGHVRRRRRPAAHAARRAGRTPQVRPPGRALSAGLGRGRPPARRLPGRLDRPHLRRPDEPGGAPPHGAPHAHLHGLGARADHLLHPGDGRPGAPLRLRGAHHPGADDLRQPGGGGRPDRPVSRHAGSRRVPAHVRHGRHAPRASCRPRWSWPAPRCCPRWSGS